MWTKTGAHPGRFQEAWVKPWQRQTLTWPSDGGGERLKTIEPQEVLMHCCSTLPSPRAIFGYQCPPLPTSAHSERQSRQEAHELPINRTICLTLPRASGKLVLDAQRGNVMTHSVAVRRKRSSSSRRGYISRQSKYECSRHFAHNRISETCGALRLHAFSKAWS